MRTKLEFQADRIEAVLALHNVQARVTGGTVTPRWVKFQVLPAVGAKISDIRGLSEEIAAALDVPSVKVSRRGAAVAIEVPRDDSQPVRLLPLHNQLVGGHTGPDSPIPPVTAILGLAEDGAPLLIRLPSPDVGHILIAGAPGAGKTMLLQTMILGLATEGNPGDLAFIFVGDGLPEVARAVRRMGFVSCRITSIELSAVRAAFRTTGKKVIVTADDVTTGVFPTLPVAVAGLKRLMNRENERYNILAWDGIPPKEIVDLFPVRLVGQVASAADARLASGIMGTGAERLMGRGDFIAVAEGKTTRFQAAHVSPAEIREAVGRIGDGQVLSVTPSRPVSLPWPVSQLTQGV